MPWAGFSLPVAGAGLPGSLLSRGASSGGRDVVIGRSLRVAHRALRSEETMSQFYLSIKGARQGQFKGTPNLRNSNDWMAGSL